jgi:uncharacterized protein (DUF4415 family)
MPQRKIAKNKRRFRLNTPTEEARIQAGIKSDPDSPELTPKQLGRMRPFRELQARRFGRPKRAVRKEPVSVCLDPEVVDFFRSKGPGWQTRMNAALAEHVRRHRPGDEMGGGPCSQPFTNARAVRRRDK